MILAIVYAVHHNKLILAKITKTRITKNDNMIYRYMITDIQSQQFFLTVEDYNPAFGDTVQFFCFVQMWYSYSGFHYHSW